MARTALIVLAALGLFMFPWPLTAVLLVAAGLSVPPFALVAGVLTDTLYYAPGAGFLPWGTALGLAGFFLALAMRDFMKARIMGS